MRRQNILDAHLLRPCFTKKRRPGVVFVLISFPALPGKGRQTDLAWPHHRHFAGGVFIRALDGDMKWAVVYGVKRTPPHLLAERATRLARPTRIAGGRFGVGGHRHCNRSGKVI